MKELGDAPSLEPRPLFPLAVNLGTARLPFDPAGASQELPSDPAFNTCLLSVYTCETEEMQRVAPTGKSRPSLYKLLPVTPLSPSIILARHLDPAQEVCTIPTRTSAPNTTT